MTNLDRINELARLSKTRDLTEEEKEEQKKLREDYIKDFRESFRKTLVHTKVVDEEGNDVTPEKIRAEIFLHEFFPE